MDIESDIRESMSSGEPLSSAMQCRSSIIQYSTVQCRSSMIQYSTVQYSAGLV